MNGPSNHLEVGRRQASMSVPELWLDYFALGGSASPLEVEAFLRVGLDPGGLDHDRLAHALNERLHDMGADRPIPYSLED